MHQQPYTIAQKVSNNSTITITCMCVAYKNAHMVVAARTGDSGFVKQKMLCCCYFSSLSLVQTALAY